MNHIDYPLRTLAAEIAHRTEVTHPALIDRAAIAALACVPVSRPISAPNYTSDLGLRRSPDPGAFLRAAIAELPDLRVSVEPSSAIGPLIDGWRSGALSDDRAAGHLDLLVSFAGAWREAGIVARAMIESDRSIDSWRLLTYLGAILAADKDVNAGQLFVQASRATDAGAVTRAMSVLRQAAWLIKRRDDPEGGLTALANLRIELTRAIDERQVSEGDARVIDAIATNLEALVATRHGHAGKAQALMDRAIQTISGARVVMVGESERSRYSAQIRVNRAQLHVVAGELSDALELLGSIVAESGGGDSESFSEALALTGYVQYREGDFGSATTSLAVAEQAIAAEGAPSRLALVRKNLAVAALFDGDEEAAGRAMHDLGDDPIGSGLLAGRAA